MRHRGAADIEADNRRSTRLSLSLPIVIHGKDTQQQAFRESTHTLMINRHGAKLFTHQQLAIGAEILVENPTLGSVAKANVVWVSPQRNANGLREAGVQLVEAQNIWGLEFPPDDWTAEGKDAVTPATNTAPTPHPVMAERPPVETPPPISTSEEIATQILQDLHETTDAHARQFRETLDQVVQQVGREVEIDLRARAGAAREQEFTAIEQQISGSSEHLSVLKVQMEELEARLAEAQQCLAATRNSIPPPLSTEQIHEKVEAEALPVLHLIIESAIGAAREHIQAQAKADAGQALKDWKSNLLAERNPILEEARQEVMMAISSARETLNREHEAALKEMKRQILEEIQANKERVNSQIKAKLDATAESHSASLVDRLKETVRETGERQASLLETQLDALLVTRLAQAEERAQSMAESLQTNLEEGLRAAGEKSSRELQAHLQEIADGAVASSSAQIHAQVETSAKAAAEKSLEVWQSQLEDIANKAAASSLSQMRAQVEEAAQAAAEEALQAWKARLQECADKIVTSSRNQISAVMEESTQATADKALAAWQARLREAGDRAAASSRDQVQGQINEALNLLGPKLMELQEHAVNDALETFRSRISQILAMFPAAGNK